VAERPHARNPGGGRHKLSRPHRQRRIHLEYPTVISTLKERAETLIRYHKERHAFADPKQPADSPPPGCFSPYGVSECEVRRSCTRLRVTTARTLDEEALVERSAEVKWNPLTFLAAATWAETYDVLTSNVASTFVAPNGPENAMQQISSIGSKTRVAVTGSFAASRIAPVRTNVAYGYCGDVQAVARTHSLLLLTGAPTSSF